MRFHSDTLTNTDMFDARHEAGVHFYKFEEKRSRSRNQAWEFRLEGWTSNRLLNFGDGYTTAATWDEWGIFLNVLFQRDPQAHCAFYRGLEDFQIATGHRFDTLKRADQHPNHKFAWNGEVSACKCGAVQRHQRPKVLVYRHALVRIDRIEEVEGWLATA